MGTYSDRWHFSTTKSRLSSDASVLASVLRFSLERNESKTQRS